MYFTQTILADDDGDDNNNNNNNNNNNYCYFTFKNTPSSS